MARNRDDEDDDDRAPKRSLFGMNSDDLADALDAIYKRQKRDSDKLDALVDRMDKLIAALTQANVQQPGQVNDPGDDGIPPLVKWALSQPWGMQLMQGLTDQQMLQGLVQMGFAWIKDRAARAAQAQQQGGSQMPPGPSVPAGPGTGPAPS